MKLLLLLSTLSLMAFSKSGDGVSNGGLAYSCKVDGFKGRKVTILLDLFEDLESFYDKDFFKRKLSKNYEFSHYLQNTSLTNETLMSDVRQFVSTQSVRNYFSYTDISNIEKAKEKILSSFQTVLFERMDLINFTQDEKSIHFPSKKTLDKYGLYDCKIAQLAILMIDKQTGRKLGINIYLLKNLDDLGYVALLWHEVIYFAYRNGSKLKDEKDSFHTRKRVRKVIKQL